MTASDIRLEPPTCRTCRYFSRRDKDGEQIGLWLDWHGRCTKHPCCYPRIDDSAERCVHYRRNDDSRQAQVDEAAYDVGWVPNFMRF